MAGCHDASQAAMAPDLAPGTAQGRSPTATAEATAEPTTKQTAEAENPPRDTDAPHGAISVSREAHVLRDYTPSTRPPAPPVSWVSAVGGTTATKRNGKGQRPRVTTPTLPSGPGTGDPPPSDAYRPHEWTGGGPAGRRD